MSTQMPSGVPHNSAGAVPNTGPTQPIPGIPNMQQRPPASVILKQMMLITGPDADPTVTFCADISQITPAPEAGKCFIILSSGPSFMVYMSALDLMLMLMLHGEQGHDVIRLTDDVLSTPEFISDMQQLRSERFASVDVLRQRAAEARERAERDTNVITDLDEMPTGAPV